MRIAFCTTEYTTETGFDGGLANYVHRVSISLMGLGHDPIVVVLSDRNETFIDKGVEVHRVRPGLGWIDYVNRFTYNSFDMSLYLIELGLSLNRELKRIHAHTPLSLIQYTSLGGVSLFRPREIPAIIRLSSFTPMCKEKGAYDYLSQFQIRQQEIFEIAALKRANAVFSPSKVVAQAVEDDIGKYVQVIESPYIPDIVQHDEKIYQNFLLDKKYLLFFGTLSVLKGVALIADVIHKFLDNYPHFHFVFIGKEQSGFRGAPMMEYVWQIANEHRDRVIYLEQLRHEQLFPILCKAHAVVLPSRIDNFPNTCIEAMAHERVVIGTRGTSFEQLIVDGESGFLCEVDDSASLFSAIERVMNLSDSERKIVGQKAGRRIDKIAPEKTVADLVDFYNRVIERWHHQRLADHVLP